MVKMKYVFKRVGKSPLFHIVMTKKEIGMKNSTENTVLALAEPIAESLGVYVVDVSSKKESGERYLRIFIDKEGGVGIDDCEAFSRAIDPILDEYDPIPEAYSLEVSSPGADRKLETEREFKYYIGREVDVKLYKALDGVKEFTGILSGYEDDTVYIRFEENEKAINRKEAVYIRLHFKF